MNKDMTDEELDEVKEFRKHLYKLTSQSDFFSAGVEYGKRLQIAKDAAIYTKLWNDKFNERSCDKCRKTGSSGTFFSGISAYKKAILNQEKV